MINFFNSQFPSRVIYLFILFVLAVIASYFVYEVDTNALLKSQILGEKIFYNSMYSEVWDNSAPIFAYFLWVIYLLGNSKIIYLVLGSLFIFGQGLLLNGIFNKMNLLKNRSFVPALVYVVLHLLFFEWLYFSPELLGTTFLLLAFNLVLSLNAKEDYGTTILNIGFLFGLSLLCSINLMYYFFVIMTGILSFTSLKGRNIVILLFGLILPFLIFSTIFFLNDSLDYFYSFYILNMFNFFIYDELNFTILWRFLVIPGFVFLIVIFRTFSDSSISNFAGKVKALFLWQIVYSFMLLLIDFNDYGLQQLYLIIFPITFFISYTFLIQKNNFIRNVFFYVILLLPFGINYQYGKIKYSTENVNFTKSTPNTIFAFGKPISFYKNQKMGTGFVNQELFQSVQIETNREVAKFYKAFNINKPNVVYDDADKTFKRLLNRIPILESEYTEKQSGVYYLK